MTQSIGRMLPKLRCPRSHTSLQIASGLLVSQAGINYPIVAGKPVLVRQVADIHIHPPVHDIVSQNIPVFRVPEWINDPDALILHLGSGNIPCPDPRVISLDVVPCENVDIVGEAESLPFWDQTFDYIESGAVFEHLYDPIKAIKEVRRVLKPGGKFRIDTAFMQGYHGYPGHYFNMTPQAIETHLVDDFDLELATVPDSATPIHTVLDILERFLYHVSEADRNALLNKPLKSVMKLLESDQTRQNPLLAGFDEHAMRALCGSFVVIARKPEDYEAQLSRRMNESEDEVDIWQTLKREYYTARTGLIYRYYEVRFFMRLSKETGRNSMGLEEPEDINQILERCKPGTMLEPGAVRAAIGAIQAQDDTLTGLRDRWIKNYSQQPQRNKIKDIFLPPGILSPVKSAIRKVDGLRKRFL